MNFFTHKQTLMFATAVFAIVCFVNFIVLRRLHRVNSISNGLFQISTLFLFTYFLVTGGTAGFSPLWILLMPACGMMFLGKRKGALSTMILLAVVVFFLWTPWGQGMLQFDYTPEFRMRFPVVYIAFFGVGYSFELVRFTTYQRMQDAQHQLTDIAENDPLTHIHNRYWFYQHFGNNYTSLIAQSSGAMVLIDIDNFKKVNDNYGHDMGDNVLVGVAQAIASSLDQEDMLCRWGGEEFLIYHKCGDLKSVDRISDRLHEKIRGLEFDVNMPDKLHITVSIGLSFIPHNCKLPYQDVFVITDQAAYTAKHQGKNQTVVVNAGNFPADVSPAAPVDTH